MGGEEVTSDREYDSIVDSSGLDVDQIESLKKGFDGFDKEEEGAINQTTMQMILKSMGVKVEKDDMENYAGEVDEEGCGKFTFFMFCQVNKTWSQVSNSSKSKI